MRTFTSLFFLFIFAGCSSQTMIHGTVQPAASSTPDKIPSATPFPTPDIPLDITIQIDNLSVPAMTQVHFSTIVTGGVPPFAYTWDFQSEPPYLGVKHLPDPYFVFATPGDYQIVVRVTDAFGRKAEASETLKVTPISYQVAKPIRYINVHGTADQPVIIEGFDISGENTNGIALVNCSYVVIRNNHVHNMTDNDMERSISGNAIYVQNSDHISILNNYVHDNTRGINVNSTPDADLFEGVVIQGNVVINNQLDNAILVRGGRLIEVGGNLSINNGDPEYFEKHRLQGVVVWDAQDVNIHDNYAYGSTSDGIALATSREMQAEKNDFYCSNYTITRNVSVKNGEQGIWLSGTSDGLVSNNIIDQITKGDGIMVEGDNHQVTIADNSIVDSGVSGIWLESSWDITIARNRISSTLADASGIWVGYIPHDYYRYHVNENILINHNVITDNRMGIELHAANQVIVVNNTVARNGQVSDNPAGILVMAEMKNTVVANNVFGWNDGWGIVNDSNTTFITSNISYANTGAIRTVVPDEGTITADPVFISRMTDYFMPISGSPCINGGKKNFDFRTEPHPVDDPVDIGAYEYHN
jgi:parallel beta-helix repeat protein